MKTNDTDIAQSLSQNSFSVFNPASASAWVTPGEPFLNEATLDPNLLEMHRTYGDSILYPIRVLFSEDVNGRIMNWSLLRKLHDLVPQLNPQSSHCGSDFRLAGNVTASQLSLISHWKSVTAVNCTVPTPLLVTSCFRPTPVTQAAFSPTQSLADFLINFAQKMKEAISREDPYVAAREVTWIFLEGKYQALSYYAEREEKPWVLPCRLVGIEKAYFQMLAQAGYKPRIAQLSIYPARYYIVVRLSPSFAGRCLRAVRQTLLTAYRKLVYRQSIKQDENLPSIKSHISTHDDARIVQ